MIARPRPVDCCIFKTSSQLRQVESFVYGLHYADMQHDLTDHSFLPDGDAFLGMTAHGPLDAPTTEYDLEALKDLAGGLS